MTAAAIGALFVVLGSSCSSGDTTTGANSTAESTERTSHTERTDTSAADTSTASTSSLSSSATGPSSTAGPEQLPSAEQQEIIERYTAYWDARFFANSGTPNPQAPALVEYATGSQLEAVIAETQANLDEGRAFRERSDPANYRRVEVVSVAGDEAVVQECVVDDALLIVRSTGEVLNDTVATHNIRGRLRRVDGAWRVSGTSLVQRWEGVAGCALAS